MNTELNPEYYQVYTSLDLYYGIFICSFLSLIGSSLMIAIIIVLKHYKSILDLVILIISISEVINCLARILRIYFINEYDTYFLEDYKYLSRAQAFFIYLTDTITLVFFAILCRVLYNLVKNNDKTLFSRKIFVVSLGLIFSFIMTLIIMFIHWEYVLKKENEEGDLPEEDIFFGWSWIKVRLNSDKDPQYTTPIIITIIFYWLIIIFIYFIMIDLILFMRRKIKERDISNQMLLKKACITFLHYPLIGSFYWIFTTLSLCFRYKFYGNSSENRFQFVVLVIANILTCIRGFFLFLQFISEDKVSKALTPLTNKIIDYIKSIYIINTKIEDDDSTSVGSGSKGEIEDTFDEVIKN